MNFILSRSGAVFAAFCVALCCGTASAQNYPTKPIRLVLPFPPASPSDLVGRMVAQKLSEQLGENVIPDNRPGAGGNLALAAVARSAPDGYTLTISTPGIALSPSLYKNLQYDPVKDLVPVARLATIENVVLVHPSVPAKNLKEFLALARARPGKLNYGSGGPGTTNHLANELLKYLEKIDIVHVPYKGATVATVSLIGGEVDEVIVSVASGLPYIASGKVRPIAVLSENRLPTLPNVPTSKEQGYPKFQMAIWYGMFAPAGTPQAIITRLNQAFTRISTSADTKERFAGVGTLPMTSTPEQFADFLKKEIARWGKVVRDSGASAE